MTAKASLTEGCQQQREVAPQLLQRQGSRSAGKCGRMLESLEPLPLQWKGKVQRKNQSPPTVHVEEIVSIEIISGLSCLSGIHRYRSAGYQCIRLHDCISRLESNSSLRVSTDLLPSNSSSAVTKSLLVMFSFCRLGLKRKPMGRAANTVSLEARLLDLFMSFDPNVPCSRCPALRSSTLPPGDQVCQVEATKTAWDGQNTSRNTGTMYKLLGLVNAKLLDFSLGIRKVVSVQPMSCDKGLPANFFDLAHQRGQVHLHRRKHTSRLLTAVVFSALSVSLVIT